jgi:hypothetical protein
VFIDKILQYEGLYTILYNPIDRYIIEKLFENEKRYCDFLISYDEIEIEDRNRNKNKNILLIEVYENFHKGFSIYFPELKKEYIRKSNFVGFYKNEEIIVRKSRFDILSPLNLSNEVKIIKRKTKLKSLNIK